MAERPGQRVMIMLSTAESLLGLSRHLAAYAMGPARAALGQLEFAGSLLELSVRLRGGGTSTGDRVAAIALDAGITRRALLNDYLPTLESLKLVSLETDASGTLVSVSELMPGQAQLLNMAGSFLAMAMPQPVERAVLAVLDATTVMPLTVAGAVEVGTAASSEEEAERALGYLESLRLCTKHRSAEGVEVVYNPNVWAVDAVDSAAALRAEDGAVRAALTGLIEEVGGSAGLPEDSVTSVTKDWVNYAVSRGLLNRSLVVTTDGQEKAFLFSPHMSKSAFDQPTGIDPSGHVRQLIGSMVYAKNYASYKLYSPAVFLERLVENGEAGDASSIATDYPMLEASGILKVERATKYHKLVLLQADVAQEAITYLEEAGSAYGSITGLRDQRSWEHPERQRVKMANVAAARPEETANLLAALRQEVGGRGYGR